MMIFAAVVLVIGALVFTLAVRSKDLEEPEPDSPTRHLEERKATIYENLRDLQFEYRLGKLSDGDYKQTKQDLQRELATVLAAIDAVPQPGAGKKPEAKKVVAPHPGTVCPHCGAKFPAAMKFCGECGKPIPAEVSR
jgi:hypothetical protein